MAAPTLEDVFAQLAVEHDAASIARSIADVVEA